jgi:hypothetical protein
VNDHAIDWLLAHPEPAIRRLARRDLLGEESTESVLAGDLVQSLLVAHDVHPYGKWRGAHWRLVSLVELGIPPGEPRALAAAETVLAWLTGKGHRANIPTIAGRVRRCASQEGNALAVCVRLGLADDRRVELLARSLVEWQWPDGGWNCDRRPDAHRSSFHESLAPAWGLHEYAAATGAAWARAAADSAAELFLSHRLFRSLRTGEVINKDWLVPHYPPFWHYDATQALLVLARMGKHRDPRAADARDVLAARRGNDGLWSAGRAWWKRPGAKGGNVEVVDWGQKPSAMVTLNALRVLQSA